STLFGIVAQPLRPSPLRRGAVQHRRVGYRAAITACAAPARCAVKQARGPRSTPVSTAALQPLWSGPSLRLRSRRVRAQGTLEVAAPKRSMGRGRPRMNEELWCCHAQTAKSVTMAGTTGVGRQPFHLRADLFGGCSRGTDL